MERTTNALAKLDRMNKALRHEEGDRVPVSDFFWGSFLSRWREELGLAPDTDIYDYYDLDWLVTIPNLDPHIKPFETLKETQDEVIVRTGFEAVLRKKFADPMPEFIGFETDTIEKEMAFTFEDPWDDRRFFSAGDNQIAGVGDGFERNSPPWIETVKSRYPTIPVYGSICEANEYMTRIVGPANNLLWAALYPEEHGAIYRAHQRILHRIAQGADQGGRRPVGWHGDLGRCGLQERYVFLARLVASALQTLRCRDGAHLPRGRLARDLPWLRERQTYSATISSKPASMPTTPWKPRPGWMWWTCAASTVTNWDFAAT